MNCSAFKQLNIIKLLIILLFISSVLLIGSTNSPAPDNKSSNDKINYTEITNFYICEIKDIIDPPTSNHLRKCLKKSLDSGYGLIILMDTPGGLEASMREIILDILNTNIPVDRKSVV